MGRFEYVESWPFWPKIITPTSACAQDGQLGRLLDQAALTLCEGHLAMALILDLDDVRFCASPWRHREARSVSEKI